MKTWTDEEAAVANAIQTEICEKEEGFSDIPLEELNESAWKLVRWVIAREKAAVLVVERENKTLREQFNKMSEELAALRAKL